LPAAPETVVRYMASIFDLGDCSPDSITAYLATIRAVHRVAGKTHPTEDPFVADARVGFRRKHTDAVGALPDFQGSLAPEAVEKIVQLGIGASDAATRWECAGITLAYLILNHPGAAANVRARDVRLTATGVQVQVPIYKMGVLKKGWRLAFSIPTAAGGWGANPPMCLLRSVWVEHYRSGRVASEHLFAPPVRGALKPLSTEAVTAWMRRLLPFTTCMPPLGVKWTGHSPRAGAASSAYAVGLPPPLIQQNMGLSSVDTSYKHCTNAQWPSTPAARAQFAHYFPLRV